MTAGRHLGFRLKGHNVWMAWAKRFKFGTGLEIHEQNRTERTEYHNWQKKSPRWPPAAILDFGWDAI